MSEPKFIPIPPKETLLQNLREGMELANFTQRDLAKLIGDSQGNISKQLRGKKPINIDRIIDISSLILERICSIPQKPLEEIYIKSEKVTTVNPENLVSLAIKRMKEGDFTQLPVIDNQTGKCLGLVTEFTIMKRAFSPLTFKKQIENASNSNSMAQFDWLNELKAMPILEAKVIDQAPTYLLDTPISEIIQALHFHYGVLVLESRGKIGIVTRFDILEKII